MPGQAVTFVVNRPVNYFVIEVARARIHTLHFPTTVEVFEYFKTMTEDGPIVVHQMADQLITVVVRAHAAIGDSVNVVLHFAEYAVNLTFTVSDNPQAPPLAGRFVTKEQAEALAAQVSTPEPAPKEASAPAPQAAPREQRDRSRALQRSLRALRKERRALEAQIAALMAEHARTVEQLAADNAALMEQIAAQQALIADLEAAAARQDQLITEVSAQLAAHEAQREKERQEREEQAIAMTERRLLRETDRVAAERVIPGQSPDVASGPYVEVCSWKVWGGLVFLECEFVNKDPRPYLLTRVQVLDEHQEANHAGEIEVDRQFAPTHGVIAIVPPRGRVTVKAAVREPDTIGRHVSLLLSEESGKRDVIHKAETWIHASDVPKPPPPDPDAGVVTVSVKGTYGAIWLGDGAGLDRSEATSLTGLGVGISYGVSRLLAFEAELMGAKTGDARFADVPYNGTTGTLERSATLGRVQGGAMLRFGEGWYQVVGRAGVGLQGASHSGQMTTGTGEAPGPESFEWSTLFTFGAGLDLRLGALRAGISLSVVNPWGDLGDGLARAAIEAGAHVGLRWN